MENLAKSLENKQILVISAETVVNNKSNKSRITNKVISLGLITSSRNDFDAYFENITIGDNIFKPNFYNNKIRLWSQNYRIKSIDIEEFEII